MKNRITDLCRGLVANFKFSNGLYITYNRLFRREARGLTYIWKNRLFIVCNCALRDHICVQEIFAEGMYAPFLDQCSFPGSRINYVNVGANIGAFDLWLRERGLEIESGISAELNPLTYQRCLLNVQTNELPNVRVINCGVAGQDGSLDFTPSRVSLGDNIFSAAGAATARDASSMRVELVSLETLLQRHGGKRSQFDLLKLDCEGAEYPILRLTPVAVLRQFHYILVEFHQEPAGESAAAAYERLRQAGFTSQRGQPEPFMFVDMFTRA